MAANVGKLFCLFAFFVTSACGTTSTVRFETKAKATLSVVEWGQLDRQGKELGETPQDVEIDEIKDKVLKIEAPGKTPQYWVFTEKGGEEFEAKLTLTDIGESSGTGSGKGGGVGGGGASTFDINETHRLLMKSYQSLASGDLTAATAFAKKLNEIEPRLAAPHIIIGLAAIQKGEKDTARLSFDKAKTLDPKDGDIEKLSEASK